MNEVRRATGSRKADPGDEARPGTGSIARERAHGVVGDGMSGRAGHMNQGDLAGCWKEPVRSQSPRSSEEAGNDRGAKGGRKVDA